MRLDEMSPYMPKAVIAIEDRRFNSHFGVDPIGLARAMVANLSPDSWSQGGSTLTQQLAKNLFLEPDRTIGRKIQEVLLALWLETQVHQGPNPRNVSQPRLFRLRRLWRRRGLAALFQQVRRAR